MSIIAELKEEISKLQTKIQSIQGNCNHPEEALTFVYKSDIGNWDRNEDSYWTNYTCNLCEKKWSEDGSHSLPKCHRYRK
jgi:hypothetical protein